MSKRKIMFCLTKEQEKHLETLRWLFSEEIKDRRSGRSYLLAVVFILKAFHTYDWVVVRDHRDFRPANDFLLDTICCILKHKNIKFERRTDCFRLK